MQFHTILFATDLSPESRRGFDMACELARDHDARLVVLHVVPPGSYAVETIAMLGQNGSPTDFDDGLRSDLRHFQTDDAKPNIEYRLAKGDPGEVILQVANDTACDMIVLTRHESSGLGRLLLGSVVEHVMRHASCPVLVTRPSSLVHA
jgi:nucleotide-binding universal stress UspA family protein